MTTARSTRPADLLLAAAFAAVTQVEVWVFSLGNGQPIGLRVVASVLTLVASAALAWRRTPPCGRLLVNQRRGGGRDRRRLLQRRLPVDQPGRHLLDRRPRDQPPGLGGAAGPGGRGRLLLRAVPRRGQPDPGRDGGGHVGGGLADRADVRRPPRAGPAAGRARPGQTAGRGQRGAPRP